MMDNNIEQLTNNEIEEEIIKTAEFVIKRINEYLAQDSLSKEQRDQYKSMIRYMQLEIEKSKRLISGKLEPGE
jgi:DNA topoisomerase VI subunit B